MDDAQEEFSAWEKLSPSGEPNLIDPPEVREKIINRKKQLNELTKSFVGNYRGIYNPFPSAAEGGIPKGYTAEDWAELATWANERTNALNALLKKCRSSKKYDMSIYYETVLRLHCKRGYTPSIDFATEAIRLCKNGSLLQYCGGLRQNNGFVQFCLNVTGVFNAYVLRYVHPTISVPIANAIKDETLSKFIREEIKSEWYRN